MNHIVTVGSSIKIKQFILIRFGLRNYGLLKMFFFLSTIVSSYILDFQKYNNDEVKLHKKILVEQNNKNTNTFFK